MVYSITSRVSLERARHHLETISQNNRLAGNDRPTILVGNKMDLERYRYGKKYKCQFMFSLDFENLFAVKSMKQKP